MNLIRAFLREALQSFTTVLPTTLSPLSPLTTSPSESTKKTRSIIETATTRRVIACLDVRADDHGNLVVTKGDQYNVRDTSTNAIRNLGDPVDMASTYFDTNADEICFLNITSFRSFPLNDQPMLEVLRRASSRVFVPMTIGGGIRDFVEPDGQTRRSAVEVASAYFRSGADKVSIGSDAVYAAEAWWARGGKSDETSSIETIAKVYGRQAVVVSIDPKRVWVKDVTECPQHTCIKSMRPGPQGERFCWYQCTVKGGREERDIDVGQLVKACECLGAGEFLVNCMDQDGTKDGFDLPLLTWVKSLTKVPVVASSGAGCAEDFVKVFKECNVEAALAAGIFHRNEVTIDEVKIALADAGMPVRRTR